MNKQYWLIKWHQWPKIGGVPSTKQQQFIDGYVNAITFIKNLSNRNMDNSKPITVQELIAANSYTVDVSINFNKLYNG